MTNNNTRLRICIIFMVPDEIITREVGETTGQSKKLFMHRPRQMCLIRRRFWNKDDEEDAPWRPSEARDAQDCTEGYKNATAGFFSLRVIHWFSL